MKVQLHRRSAFEMPRLNRRQVTEALQTIFSLLPKGSDRQDYTFREEGKPPSITVDYSESLANVRRDRLRADFLKKYRGFSSGNPREAAVTAFLAAEVQCKETNNRIRRTRAGVVTPYVDSIMLMAQRKIAYVLGTFNPSELLDEARWGPGSTSAVSGSRVSSENKYRAKLELTPGFYETGAKLLSLLPSWSALQTDCDFGTWVTPLPSVIRGSRISFVPKTVETDRIIAVEPHVNVYFQNGVGRMLRKRLKRHGIDLDDQSLNQRLARQGSIDNSLATIDLSSASDTISKLLVEELLPSDWYQWMNLVRSHEGKLANQWIKFEKFSSMGNGFTFDLESLIFWALSRSVCEFEGYNPFWVNVFGDDIVIPSGIYDKVTQVLAWAGFSVNLKKSFHNGPFRESCGRDFLEGADVRPVYLKDIPNTPIHWIRLANALRRLSHSWAEKLGCDASLRPAYEFAVSMVPREFRKFRISHGFGDTGLVVNFDEAVPVRCGSNNDSNRAGWEGYVVTHLPVKATTYFTDSRALITASVRFLSDSGNNVPLRDVVSLREASLVVPSWYDLGPWV